VRDLLFSSKRAFSFYSTLAQGVGEFVLDSQGSH
jgi:hypothetical protein